MIEDLIKKQHSAIYIKGVPTLVGKRNLFLDERYRSLQVTQRKYAKCKDINKQKKIHIETARIVSQLDLPKLVLDETNFLFEKIEKDIQKCSKILNVNNLVPTLIFIASEKLNYNVELSRILEYSKVRDKAKFNKSLYMCKFLLKAKGQPVQKSFNKTLSQSITIFKKIENNSNINHKKILTFLLPYTPGLREKTRVSLVVYFSLKLVGKETKKVPDFCDIHPRKLRKSINRVMIRANTKSVEEFCRLIKASLEDKDDRSNITTGCQPLPLPDILERKRLESTNTVLFGRTNQH